MNPSTKPRIAFFGTPDFAVWVLDALKDHDIVPDLIVAAPDAPKGRKLVMTPPATKVWAAANGVMVTQPTSVKKPEFIAEITALAPANAGWDLFIVAAYGKIIPQAVLDIPKHKTINIHPSLLPLLRGSAPLQGAILNDMRDTGTTIMRLDAEMDHGPILIQKKADLPIWPVDQTVLGVILAHDGGAMIAEILPTLLNGTLKETEQNHAAATYTKKITKEDGLIDLAADGYQNFLKYNAYRGWPGSYFFATQDGVQVRMKISDAALENGKFVIRTVIPEGKKEIRWS